MRLEILGVGNALTVDHYNTCFVLSDGPDHFLVDAGGGNRLFRQFRDIGLNWEDIHQMFITHHHIDHFLGAIWMIRMVGHHCRVGSYQGAFTVYGNDDVIVLLEQMCHQLLNPDEVKFFGDVIRFVVVRDGETREIMGRDITFFDIHSSKLVQYGFVMDLDADEDFVQTGTASESNSRSSLDENGKRPRRIVCCGDEPFHEAVRKYAQGCDWLLHEAFCLHAQREIYQPYRIHHSTVRDACENAESLGACNLVLYHTEEGSEPYRQRLYLEEARRHFSGNVCVPDDLDIIELD